MKITQTIKIIKKYILVSLAVIASSIHAQDIHTGYHSNSFLLQSSVNPAIFPQANTVVSFPILAHSSYNFQLPFSLNEVMDKGNDDSLRISLPHIASNTSKHNILHANINRNLFFVGLKVGKKKDIFAYIGDDIYGSFGMNFSGSFIDYLAKGNASFLNNQQYLDDEQIEVLAYNKFYLGASYIVNKKWNVGARLNFLTGLVNIHTDKMSIGLYTDSTSSPIYQTIISTDMLIQTSGLGLTTDSLEFNPTANSGFSIDLGTTYKYSDEWTFSLAIKDLGAINWAEENSKLYSTEGESSFVIEGLTQTSSGGEDLIEQMEEITDSLTSQLEPVSLKRGYKTKLNSNIYLGAHYTLSKKHQFSALLHRTKRMDQGFTVFSLAYHYQLAKSFELLGSYRNLNGINNLGTGFVWNSNAMQLHFILDNILVLDVFDAKNFAYQFGLSFHFGK